MFEINFLTKYLPAQSTTALCLDITNELNSKKDKRNGKCNHNPTKQGLKLKSNPTESQYEYYEVSLLMSRKNENMHFARNHTT